jgi:DNA processing protein
MACGLTATQVADLTSNANFDSAQGQVRKLRSKGVHLISYQDRLYPPLLKEIFDPPLVLYAQGEVKILNSLQIGVVGSRRPSPYGIQAAEKLSAELVRTGLTVTSGMARGIDTAAHRAAMSAGGKTIAVFGSGLDHIYPSENRPLAEQLSREGLLLSEFPLSTPAYPQNFPIRNRIISGMSLGILVVEGAQYSGSGITARLAIEHNREVFAVPGSILSPLSAGPNLLIRQGATLVTEGKDVLEPFTPDVRRRIAEQTAQPTLFQEPGFATDEELDSRAMAPVYRGILGTLERDKALHLDELVQKLGRFSSSEIIAALLDLELEGRVRQMSGKRFLRAL